MQSGDFQTTTERGREELKVWDGNTWVAVVSTQQIKAWIASLNLFEGTVQEVGGAMVGAMDFAALPDLTTASTGDLSAHYYTFVGTPGYIIKAADPKGLGADLKGAVLNPGDWLSVVNRATAGNPPNMHWVHIGGDLLAKSRADSLYGLKNWVAGSYEQDTLVNHGGSIWRANSAIIATDVAPDAAKSKWTRIALAAGAKSVPADGDLPATASPSDLYLVLNSFKGGNKPALFSYDAGASKWQQLGGGDQGIPLTLTGGNVIYPDVLYWDRKSAAPAGRVINDLLLAVNPNVLRRWDGTQWVDILLSVPVGVPADQDKFVIMDPAGNPSLSTDTFHDAAVKAAGPRLYSKYIPPGPEPVFIDLGDNKWKVARICGALEAAGSTIHIFFQGFDHNGNLVTPASNMKTIYGTLQWGDSNANSTAKNRFFYFDHLSLTWGGHDINSGDGVSVTRAAYPWLDLTITKLYDNYMQIRWHMEYWSYSDHLYSMDVITEWGASDGIRDMQQIQITGQGQYRLGAQLQITKC